MAKIVILGFAVLSLFVFLEAAPSAPSNLIQDQKQKLEEFRDLVNGDSEAVKGKKKPKKYKCFVVEDDEELSTMPSTGKEPTFSPHKFVYEDDKEAAEATSPMTTPSAVRHVRPTTVPKKQESFKQVISAFQYSGFKDLRSHIARIL